METEEKRNLLNEFLEMWPEARVRKMTLGEYVGVEDKNTFTYWVETGMRDLGSIKGMTSIKFGIYKRDPKKEKKPKINISDVNIHGGGCLERIGRKHLRASETKFSRSYNMPRAETLRKLMAFIFPTCSSGK